MHSWRKLWVLLERMPVSSAYREAMVNDPDVAELIADSPKQRARPLLREFTPEAALLTAIADRLTEVVVAVAALGGAKNGKPDQLPRPETAIDRVHRDRARKSFESLLDDVAAAQDRWALEHGEPPTRAEEVIADA